MSAATAVLRRPAGPVLADYFAGTWARDAVLIFCGALLTAALAQISMPVPGSPVPVSGQTLAVTLVGATLGARRGALALALYLVLGLMFPVYSEGAQGTEILFGATGGYIVGFIFAAYAIGYLSERGADRKLSVAFLTFVTGQLIVFGFGLPWLMISADLTVAGTISAGFTPFIIGGLVKAAAAAIALPGAWKLAKRFRDGGAQG